ncbi:MAG TPA: restriction endonuclease subunit S [Candidatus Binatia bacterium]|nr:restriction endonuclease subunit S [Candidatus Binatia bacterium]
MAAEWQKLSLDECMAAIIDYRGKTPRKTTAGIPLVTAKIIKGGRIESPQEFIDPVDYDGWMRRGIPKAGDIVLTTEAPLGQVAQLDGNNVALAQRVVTLRGKEGVIDNTFLKFLLQSRSVQEQLRGRSTGTTVHGIRQSELRKVLLLVPPFVEQRAIAHILGTLDDKIELNRRMSETLEAMARAIFKSWFVDFDPVRVKAEGRDPGLPKPIADLFPDRFQEPELGEIPEGWAFAPLPEVIEVNPPRTLRRGEVAPYLDMANMPTRVHSPDAVIDRPFGSGIRFMNGDTLVARITACFENGKTAYVDFLDDGQVGWGSTEYIVLRPRAPLPTEFAYCLARSSGFREFAIHSMTGSSGRQRVPAESLSHYVVVTPSKEVAQRFGELVAPLFARARATTQGSRKLAALRDSLLPKLICGELRVRDAEQLLSEAGI